MIIESSNGGSEKEAAWMVGMTIYLPGVGILVCPHGRKSQKRRPPKGGHQIWASARPSGLLLTAAAKPPSRKRREVTPA